VPIELEPLINERRLGEWNSRTIAETEEMLAKKVTPPGGESEEQFSVRIGKALEELRRFHDRRPLS
jgi:probable phosphoglycerate mutase